MKKTIIAFDIDGTLEEYGGTISRETIKKLKPLAHVGICSSRGDSWSIARKYGLGFGETGKSICLRHFKHLWGKNCVGFLYIGDTVNDEFEAKKSGFNFVYAQNIKLNLGCGNDIRFGYINIDIRPLKGVNLVLDLENQSLPFQDNLVSEIVAQDIIEHVSYYKVENLLKECFRVLKPKGTIYIRTPDLEQIYVKAVVEKQTLGDKKGYKLLSYWIFGGFKNPYDYHKCIFTKELLKELLEEIGFKVVKLSNDNSNIVCKAYKP